MYVFRPFLCSLVALMMIGLPHDGSLPVFGLYLPCLGLFRSYRSLTDSLNRLARSAPAAGRSHQRSNVSRNTLIANPTLQFSGSLPSWICSLMANSWISHNPTIDQSS